MSILGRYVATLYARIFGLCLGAFVAIYLIVDFIEKIDRFSQNSPESMAIARFFLYKIPEIATQVLPLAVLMATMLTLGILGRNSEITALRSCGVSLPRATRPILLIAFVVSLLTVAANELLIPVTYARMKYVEEVEIKKKSASAFFRQDNIWFRDDTAILQANLFNPGQQALHGVTLWITDSGIVPLSRIDAKSAEWHNGQWLLREATTLDFSGGTPRSKLSPQLPVKLGLKVADLKVVDKYADNMGFLQLKRYCEKLQKGGYDAGRYRALMHAKLSLPFASFIMAFLGIPFVLRSGRTSGIAVGIGLSLAIGFAYFVTNAMLVSLGQVSALPPLIAAWSANLIFTMIASWLTLTINHQ
ncbi:MAG: LPS export ABC transporter permease LptG [Geobacter sp.]|nr:LPS export ABC transporter permease LptG [Geobacter sp.]